MAFATVYKIDIDEIKDFFSRKKMVQNSEPEKTLLNLDFVLNNILKLEPIKSFTH